MMAERGRDQWSHTASLNMQQVAIHGGRNVSVKPEDFNPWLGKTKLDPTITGNGFRMLRALVKKGV